MTTTHRDPGLQPERTLLAWRRTTLTATGVLLLCSRALLGHHTAAHAVAVVLSVVVVDALCGGMAQRARRYRVDPRCGEEASSGMLMLIAAGIGCVGVTVLAG